MKNLILAVCLCTVLTLSAACGSSDAVQVSNTAPVPETLIAETVATELETSGVKEENPAESGSSGEKSNSGSDKGIENAGLQFKLSPSLGLELEAMYPEEWYRYQYMTMTVEDIEAVDNFFETLDTEVFYDVYVDSINNTDYGKANSWSFNDCTKYCYSPSKHYDSDYPAYGSHYTNYFYSPVYNFLKSTAYAYERPVYLNPVILSDKFVEHMAEDLNLSCEKFNEQKSTERIFNNNHQKVSAKPFYYYESEYAALSDVASSFGSKENDFCYLEDENLYYTYVMENPDKDSLAVYAVYVKFNEQGILYSIGIDYCYMPDDFFENYNILGFTKPKDDFSGICAAAYSANDISMLDYIGFNALKDNLTKYLNSSVDGAGALTESPEVTANVDYKVYYSTDEVHGILDQYYHVSGWWTIN